MSALLLGATATLVAALGAGAPIGPVVGGGIAVGLIALVLSLRYEHLRVMPTVLRTPAARPD